MSLWQRWAARRDRRRRHAEAVRRAVEFAGQTDDPATILHGAVVAEPAEGLVVRVVFDGSSRLIAAKPLPKRDILVVEGGPVREVDAGEAERLGVGPWR